MNFVDIFLRKKIIFKLGKTTYTTKFSLKYIR